MANVLKMYSIRDAKAEVFHPPMFALTHGEAERNLKEVAQDPKTVIGRNPEDFDLYYLGLYDEQTGKMECKDTPEHIVKAVQLARPNLEVVQ